MKDPSMQNMRTYINQHKTKGDVTSIPLDLQGYNAYIAADANSDSGYQFKPDPKSVHYKVKNSKLDADFNDMEKYQKENDESIIRTVIFRSISQPGL